MSNRIENWHSEIDINTKLFEEKFSDLNEIQINWKLNLKSWSIGQVIEHLIKTNEAYLTIADKISSKDFKPSILSKLRFVPKLFGNMILKAVDPKTERKVKTMGVFKPELSEIGLDIHEKFGQSQKQLHEFIDDNQELILNNTVVPSPVNRHIIYHFDTVVNILVNHQKRHFNQAKRVLELYNQKN